MATIRKGRNILTLMNVFTVKPENQKKAGGLAYGGDRADHESV